MATSAKLSGYLQTYVGTAVATTPVLMQHFLGSYASQDPFWDFKPDLERFSMKEMIFLERFQRTLNEHEPILPNCDEGQIAIDRDYAHSDPQQSLARFATTREAVNEFIANIKPEDWDRMAEREGVGKVTLAQHLALMAGHDAYHVRQAMDYIDAYKARMH
jgi:DinB superfamily